MNQAKIRQAVYKTAADALEGQRRVIVEDVGGNKKLVKRELVRLIDELRRHACTDVPPPPPRTGRFYKFPDESQFSAWGGVVCGARPSKGEVITLVRTDGQRKDVIVKEVLDEVNRGWPFTWEEFDPDPDRWLDDGFHETGTDDNWDVPF